MSAITNCSEKDFSQIVRIDAYPFDALSVPVPVYACTDKISNTDITRDASKKLSIPFERGSVDVTSKMKRDVSGDVHTVSVSFNLNNSTDDFSNIIAKLKHSPHHLVIEYFGNIVHLVRTSVEGYNFINEYDNGKQKLTIDLVNGQGITLVV